MDLSYEARWDNLRRRIQEDMEILTEKAREINGIDPPNVLRCATTVAALRVALDHMDDLDRAGAHRA